MVCDRYSLNNNTVRCSVLVAPTKEMISVEKGCYLKEICRGRGIAEMITRCLMFCDRYSLNDNAVRCSVIVAPTKEMISVAKGCYMTAMFQGINFCVYKA